MVGNFSFPVQRCLSAAGHLISMTWVQSADPIAPGKPRTRYISKSLLQPMSSLGKPTKSSKQSFEKRSTKLYGKLAHDLYFNYVAYVLKIVLQVDSPTPDSSKQSSAVQPRPRIRKAISSLNSNGMVLLLFTRKTSL